MMRFSIRPLDVAAAIGIATLSATVAAFALQALAKPGDFEARLESLQARTAATAAAVKARGAAPLPAGALCITAPTAAAAKVTADLKTAAADLALEHVDVVATPQAQTLEDLIPISVQVSATGPYDADLQLLQRLSGLRPLLLVDTADLTGKTSVVTFKLSGRVLCSAPR
jgi:hypothetical protein